ncbi:hypothetical protein EYF80_048964 [Liparis tanakae]|uniref:Uncharacterized protein n=1 Tax=Liparis tanakae TaxID=230148 RepID=A0A4Z2FI75_9TELE|nr:hypothetical protein EYF80_048964 [Liparis tanakae]
MTLLRGSDGNPRTSAGSWRFQKSFPAREEVGRTARQEVGVSSSLDLSLLSKHESIPLSHKPFNTQHPAPPAADHVPPLF